jgi:hypothetical protein
MIDAGRGRLALLATIAGGLVSGGLVWFAGRASPQTLIIFLISLWVLAPFVILGVALLRSSRWSVGTRRALHAVTWLVVIASLAVYALDLRPSATPPGFLFVAVPPATTLLAIVVVAMAAFFARR